MPINDKLVDNLIACTQLDAKLVANLATPAIKGPIPSTASLADIADHVVVSNLAPSEVANTSHARPTMLAGVSRFVEDVKAAWDALAPSAHPSAYSNLSPVTRQNFAEWQGMTAAVALANIYSITGLNLSVSEMRLNSRNNAAMACVMMELEKDNHYCAAVNGSDGVLYYICQNGTPFAIFHPEIGLCPMRDYDSNIFSGVIPWFTQVPGDCHAGWGDILKLDRCCLSRIALWAGRNGLYSYQTYLTNQAGPFAPMPDELDVQDSIEHASIIESVWPGRGVAFGTASMAYLDQHGTPCRMPDVFLSKMMISSIGSADNNKLVYNTAGEDVLIRFQGDNGMLSSFVPVPPFASCIMDVLGSCSIKKLDFFAEMDSQNQIKSVRVEVVLSTPTGDLHIGKLYDYEHLCLGQMPYLMLWPFVPMPMGMSLWKSFYATWSQQKQALTPLLGINGGLLPIVSGKMGFAWGNQGTTHTVSRPTAADDPWPVCVASAPLKYAILTKTDMVSGAEEELGLVFMPRYPEYNPNVNGKPVAIEPVKVAVDFGTTSTVCAMHSNLFSGNAEVTLPFKDYSCCATCIDESAKTDVHTMRWLGNDQSGSAWKWDQKLFSIAQLFNSSTINREVQTQAAKQTYYVDGRLFLACGDVLPIMAHEVRDAADPLDALRVMNDMKFNHAMKPENYHAASLFLAGIYLYAILYLMSDRLYPTQGADFIQLLVSYPNDVTLDALKQNWQFARDILSNIVCADLLRPIDVLLMNSKQFYSEATATTAYQRRPGAPVGFTSDLVSLDIGGGTSDISISNQALYPGDVRNLSVRYAGREIMVSSLVELYRRVNPATPSIVDDSSFSRLWGSNAKFVSNQFNALCTSSDTSITFLHGLTNNSSLRMDVEMLLSQGMNLGAAANLNPTNLLRQLVTMKYLMLLQVVASMVRKNIDMWKNPNTKELNLVGNSLEINLSISGTGAQLLQYVFDCPMSALGNLHVPEALPKASPMAKCLNLMNTIFNEELKDVLPADVHTRLRIYIDPNVAQKLDVCYGMLQPEIDTLIPAQPDAAGEIVPGFPVMTATDMGMTTEERNRKTAEREAQINLYQQTALDTYITGKKDSDGNTVHHGLMDYWKWYEQIFFPAPTNTNRGLGPNISTMSSLMERNTYMPFFTSARNAVKKERAAFMVEPEQQPYLEQMTGMYMVEELLDWVIAQNQ